MTPLSHSQPQPQQPSGKSKEEEIHWILLQPEVDLWRLRELALSKDGLVNGKMCDCVLCVVCLHYYYYYYCCCCCCCCNIVLLTSLHLTVCLFDHL
jgi:hypothetical protein